MNSSCCYSGYSPAAVAHTCTHHTSTSQNVIGTAVLNNEVEKYPEAYLCISAVTPMQEHGGTLKLRADAIKLYYKHNSNIEAAAAAYKAAHPEHNKRTVRSFILTAVDNFNKRYCLYDKLRSGRPPKITKQEALKASLAFASDKYTSLAEAMEKSSFLRKLVLEKGVSEQMLRRRMWEVNPLITKHKPQVKKALTPGQKKARLLRAEELLNLTEEQMDRIIWMDAKTIWVKPQRLRAEVYGLQGYADKNALRISVDNVSDTGVRLKFFTGVNKRKGRIFICYTSETTELYPKDIQEKLVVGAVAIVLLAAAAAAVAPTPHHYPIHNTLT